MYQKEVNDLLHVNQANINQILRKYAKNIITFENLENMFLYSSNPPIVKDRQ